MKLEQISNNTAFVAAAVTTLLGASLLAAYMHRFRVRVSGGPPIALLATRMEVPAGTLMGEDMLVTHLVPEAYAEGRQVLASELSRVVGLRTAINLDANQTLAWTDLSSGRRDDLTLSMRVPSGMRAMSIPHGSQTELSRMVRPGDRVDVLLTRRANGADEAAVTLVLLQSILVLAVGDVLTPLESHSDRPDSVTLLLTLEQAGLLTHARRAGELSLTLRNGDDLQINEGVPETTDRDVFVEEKRAKRQRRALIERVD